MLTRALLLYELLTLDVKRICASLHHQIRTRALLPVLLLDDVWYAIRINPNTGWRAASVGNKGMQIQRTWRTLEEQWWLYGRLQHVVQLLLPGSPASFLRSRWQPPYGLWCRYLAITWTCSKKPSVCNSSEKNLGTPLGSCWLMAELQAGLQRIGQCDNVSRRAADPMTLSVWSLQSCIKPCSASHTLQ